MRTMTPKSASKRTSSAASKIKNKILNTSSFFKVSLQTNNKALALALEAQKERNRLLEKEIMSLQRQVEALCFELATKKYKHRKLLLILDNLRCNTLQHFNMVNDLFSDSDLSKLSEDDVNKANPEVGSATDLLPPEPGPLLCPVQTVTGDTPKENCTNVFNIQNRHKNSTDTSSGNTDAVEKQCMQSPQTGTHSSISLRDEVERLSMIISQSGFDIKSVLCRQSIQPPSVVSTCENLKPSLTDDAHIPNSSVVETEHEWGHKQEKTVLLNTTMEMTQINATEIVTVETKAKKTDRSGKPKDKKMMERASGSSEEPQVKNSADSRLSEVQRTPTGTLCTDDQTLEDIRIAEVIELQSPKTRCMRAITSQIPKLSNRQERTIAKSQDKSKSEFCDIVSQDLDDYFTDREIAFSKERENVILLPERDTEEEARSKITCRRPSTKGRRVSSVTRKTFVTLPSRLHESERSQFEVEQPQMINEPQSRMKTNPGVFPRCRGTFFVSMTHGSTSSNSHELGEHDLIPFTLSSNSEAEEPPTVLDTRINQQHSESNPHGHRGGPFVEDTQSSCKHPWPATQDSGSHQDDYRSSSNREICPPNEGRAPGGESQNAKRNKRKERSKSRKRKAVHRKDWVGHLKDRKKKKKKSCSNKGFRCEDEEDLVDKIYSLGRDEEQLNDLEVVESHSDIIERNIFEHEYDSKPNELHTFTEPRNPRETFVVYRRKTQDNVSGNNTWTSDVSHACVHMMDTSHKPGHENVGDLLMDEMPPWLAIDVSTADTEVGSLLATPKRETSHRAAVIEGFAAVTTEDSPAGRVLTSLTNTVATPDSENRGRTRRRNVAVSYKEPALNSKMRRGDKFTESTFLSSSVFKDGKKKRQKKAVPKPQLESSVLMD